MHIKACIVPVLVPLQYCCTPLLFHQNWRRWTVSERMLTSSVKATSAYHPHPHHHHHQHQHHHHQQQQHHAHHLQHFSSTANNNRTTQQQFKSTISNPSNKTTTTTASQQQQQQAHATDVASHLVDTWHHKMRSTLLVEYAKYFESHGFVRLREERVNLGAAAAAAANELHNYQLNEAHMQHFIKWLHEDDATNSGGGGGGGFVYLTINLDEVFMHVRLGFCARYRYRGGDSSSSLSVALVKLVAHDLGSLVHAHSFVYDFHLAAINRNFITNPHASSSHSLSPSSTSSASAASVSSTLSSSSFQQISSTAPTIVHFLSEFVEFFGTRGAHSLNKIYKLVHEKSDSSLIPHQFRLIFDFIIDARRHRGIDDATTTTHSLATGDGDCNCGGDDGETDATTKTPSLAQPSLTFKTLYVFDNGIAIYSINDTNTNTNTTNNNTSNNFNKYLVVKIESLSSTAAAAAAAAAANRSGSAAKETSTSAQLTLSSSSSNLLLSATSTASSATAGANGANDLRRTLGSGGGGGSVLVAASSTTPSQHKRHDTSSIKLKHSGGGDSSSLASFATTAASSVATHGDASSSTHSFIKVVAFYLYINKSNTAAVADKSGSMKRFNQELAYINRVIERSINLYKQEIFWDNLSLSIAAFRRMLNTNTNTPTANTTTTNNNNSNSSESIFTVNSDELEQIMRISQKVDILDLDANLAPFFRQCFAIREKIRAYLSFSLGRHCIYVGASSSGTYEYCLLLLNDELLNNFRHSESSALTPLASSSTSATSSQTTQQPPQQQQHQQQQQQDSSSTTASSTSSSSSSNELKSFILIKFNKKLSSMQLLQVNRVKGSSNNNNNNGGGGAAAAQGKLGAAPAMDKDAWSRRPSAATIVEHSAAEGSSTTALNATSCRTHRYFKFTINLLMYVLWESLFYSSS